MTQHLLVIDGHDGSGKTTIARLLSQHLGGQYVKPFNDSLGDMIAWLWKGERFVFANALAQAAIEKVIEDNSEASLLVFDRHWLSMFTVLPENLYEQWLPHPFTILCWTDSETTVRRLSERGESISDISKHEYYCQRYRGLADRFAVPILDTTHLAPEEALHDLLSRPEFRVAEIVS